MTIEESFELEKHLRLIRCHGACDLSLCVLERILVLFAFLGKITTGRQFVDVPTWHACSMTRLEFLSTFGPPGQLDDRCDVSVDVKELFAT